MAIGRRALFLSGLGGLLGAGAIGYGGSLAACAMWGDRQAILRPLYPAIASIPAWSEIGAAWLAEETLEDITETLIRDPAVFAALIQSEAQLRQTRIIELVRAEFQSRRVVMAGRWVVAQTEARIAAARVSDTV